MDPVIVVGAGLSGVACARELTDAGIAVRVLDRGRRIGGRMASRRLEGRPADTGASYLTVGDPDSDVGFAAVVERWRAAGLAHPWTDTFTVLEAGRVPEQKSGPTRWGTSGGIRTLVEQLAEGLDVQQQEVRRVARGTAGLEVDGEPAAAVVLAMPDPQASRLLGPDLADAAAALDRAYDPQLALTARFERRTWDAVSPDGRFEGAFVNGDEALTWIADDGRRRGDDAPVLVAHSTVPLAGWHLEDPGAAEPEMVSALHRLLGVERPLETHVQRWSLAKPSGEREERSRLGGDLVGFCGDGWGPSAKVETAWLSGRDLGRRLVARLATT